ncbi:MAG: hypothetical protein DI598_01900 [Pseudopedobacter saltans]|uniref:Uncharacterized protein n=1 Tax=Pseudopedobacter saltans TaxID=151895 RepID=A0A2W5FE92_9SPHI|nr:MAG: hypothetical protein DI598_01900 [Pseudopedobacter saltans]
MSNRCELSNSIGYAGSPSLQNERMSKLAAFGDSTSLVNKLITENNPVASFYLWRALQSKSIPIPENLMKKLQEDRRKVSVINGCIKRTETLSHIIGLSL